jgi:ferritin-like metal-binding protein YciE
MKLDSLHELYLEQLRDLYDGEQRITKALPKLLEKATSQKLKHALDEHLELTKQHAIRLESIFGAMSESPKGEKCKGIEGIIDQGDDLIGDIKDPGVRDAAIIATAQRVEHYEMAGYGTARAFAALLQQQDATQMLQDTLEEEKGADKTLTSLAGEINLSAAGGKGTQAEPGNEERVA